MHGNLLTWGVLHYKLWMEVTVINKSFLIQGVDSCAEQLFEVKEIQQPHQPSYLPVDGAVHGVGETLVEGVVVDLQAHDRILWRLWPL